MASSTKPGCCSLSVTIIGRDHAEIAGMLQELDLQASTAAPSTRTDPLLRELIRTTLSHFAVEEAMMEATRYEVAWFHRLGHQLMTNQLRALAASCRKGGLQQNAHLLNLIIESHFVHVKNEDQDYTLWLGAMARR